MVHVLDASQRVVSLIWKMISTQLLFYFCTLMNLVTIHHRSLISQTTAVIAGWNINLQRAHKNRSLPTRLCEHLPGAVHIGRCGDGQVSGPGFYKPNRRSSVDVQACRHTRVPHKLASRVSEELSEGWRSWGLSWTLGSELSGRVRVERASLSLGRSCDGSSW